MSDHNMNNAVKIIAALSLLLGLSLGQINRQHQQLEVLTGRGHHLVPQSRSEFSYPSWESQKAEMDLRREVNRIEKRCEKLSRELEKQAHAQHLQSSRHRFPTPE